MHFCSGGGIAGFAMVKALEDEGIKAELMLLDLRCEALREGLEYRSEMPLLHAVSIDARNGTILRPRQLDLALICGATMAHFDPFEVHRVLASMSMALSPSGALLIEEIDRVEKVFLSTGYKYVWPEVSRRLVISVHKGYDPRTSTVIRVLVDPLSREAVEHKVCMLWTPALLASLAYVYFEHVELLLLEGKGLVLACRPRESFLPHHGLNLSVPQVLELQP